MESELRHEERKDANCSVEMVWKTVAGEKRFESCRAINLSEVGVAVECPEAIPLLAHVIIRATAFEVAALAQVRHCSWRRSAYVLGLLFVAKTSTVENDPMAPDHYEILRLSPTADADTIERVYRTLMKRFHPDNEKTGDAEIFLRIAEAHRILIDPRQREQYDIERGASNSVVRFDLRSREFFAGLKGEQNRRLAALCLLYRKRASDHEYPGLSLLDLENLSGFTREELGFAMWYLCEKSLAKVDDTTHYGITAGGVDFVENKLTDNDAGLKMIAALQIPAHNESAKNGIPVDQA
jgi:curved DNA-binding protein